MAALKRENVRFNRSIRLSNGRVIPIRKRNEPAATVYFGVRFKDGVTVFMPRAKGVEKRDLAELRAHALRVRGLPEKDSEIAVVTEACVKCARSIPGCGGCDHAAALKAEAEKRTRRLPRPGPRCPSNSISQRVRRIRRRPTLKVRDFRMVASR